MSKVLDFFSGKVIHEDPVVDFRCLNAIAVIAKWKDQIDCRQFIMELAKCSVTGDRISDSDFITICDKLSIGPDVSGALHVTLMKNKVFIFVDENGFSKDGIQPR